MAIIKRGNSWQVSVGSGSERIRRNVSSKAEAILLEAQLNQMLKEAEIARSMVLSRLQISAGTETKKGGPTLRDVFLLTKQLRWRHVSKTTLDTAEMVVNRLGEDTPIVLITREKARQLAESFEKEGNSGSTINRKMSALGVMLNIAEAEGMIDAVPKMPRRPVGKHRIRFFTPAEEARMLSICKRNGLDDIHDFVILGLDTGFRRGELLGLTPQDCVNGRAVLHAGETKSGKGRSVPLTSRARLVVEARADLPLIFNGISKTTLGKRWDVMRREMGMQDDPWFIPHTLRHTCASRLAMAGKNTMFIKEWMGHASINMTEKYMHLCASHLETGISALEGFSAK
jgi:integrase